MTKNKPIVLSNGDILLPIYDERDWSSLMMISSDEGKTWKMYGKISTYTGNIQPAVVELPDKRLLAYMRTGGPGGYIWKSYSMNFGRNWSKAELTSFRNPNSGIDLIKLKSGRLLLAFNDSKNRRTPLNIAMTKDEYESWSYMKIIESSEGEYSYPSLLQTSDNKIHLVYTNRRINIKHAVFDEEWIIK